MPPDNGENLVIGHSVRVDGCPQRAKTTPPALGQHASPDRTPAANTPPGNSIVWGSLGGARKGFCQDAFRPPSPLGSPATLVIPCRPRQRPRAAGDPYLPPPGLKFGIFPFYDNVVNLAVPVPSLLLS